MNKSFILIFTLVFLATGCQSKNIETQKQKVSYSIGWDIGNNLKQQSIEVDADILTAGLSDALSAKKSRLTQDEMRTTMTEFQQNLQKQRMEKSEADSKKNKTEGDAFLKENKSKPGVKTTASGLQYKIIKDGKGKKATAKDTVTVNYEGKLTDGKVFDSSYQRGQPATFPVTGVIPGWTEALQLMKEGSTYELYIPSELAYGERGAGGTIGPNATLIFKVELLKVESPKPQK